MATLLFTIYFQLKKLFISLRVLLFFSSNWTTKRNLSETFSNGWRRKPDKIRTKRIASNSFPDAESRTSTLIRSCRNVTCKLSEISKKNILLKICSACYTQWRFFQCCPRWLGSRKRTEAAKLLTILELKKIYKNSWTEIKSWNKNKLNFGYCQNANFAIIWML